MRPDDRRPTPLESDRDPAFAPLVEAGAEVRRGPAARVDPAFAAGLRGRLLAAYPAGAFVPSAIPAVVSTPEASADAGLRLVRPRVTARPGVTGTFPRWAILVAAAVVVLSLAGANLRGFMPPAPEAFAAGAVDATLERGATRTALAAGTELLVGDIVETATSGGATLALGGGTVRLAGGTTMEIARLDHDAIGLVQATGRAWHRVGGQATRYDVRTADVTWTATGTAFDLDRAVVDGIEQVRAVGVEHDVRIAGPELQARLPEGGVAVIALGPDGIPDIDLGDVTEPDLADPWLLANAAADRDAGWPIGIFTDRLGEPSATPSPPSEPAPTATDPASPDATAVVSAEPTAETTRKPKPSADPTRTPKPEPTPKPTPTPKPPLADLGLDATACQGSFTVLDWSKAGADRFDHYQTLRSTSTTIKPVEPPKPPAVAPDALSIGDRGTTTAIDAGLDAGTTYAYRTVAFDADHAALAVSPVKTAKAKGVGDLGSLAAIVEDGVLTVDWSAFEGPATCFTWYKLVASTDDDTPSYLDGAPYIWVGESAGTGSATIEALDPGTYHLRLQVLRSSEAGSLLVAQTEVATVTIP